MKSFLMLNIVAELWVCSFLFLHAEQPSTTLPLWDKDVPDYVAGSGLGADDGTGRIRNVGIPSMNVYVPKDGAQRHPVVILCPGGAYTHLGNVATGNGVLAPFLADGFTVIVLQYRLNPPAPNAADDALLDAKRALRLVRARAEEWKIDPKHVGMIGWSAGGNLTLNIVCHFDNGDPKAVDPVERESCRPDFVAMLCPWPNGHPISSYPLAKDAPPAFIASARDDTTAPTTFAEAIAAGYGKAGLPCKFWQIDAGGHKAFSQDSPGEGSQWRSHFMEWLPTVTAK